MTPTILMGTEQVTLGGETQWGHLVNEHKLPRELAMNGKDGDGGQRNLMGVKQHGTLLFLCTTDPIEVMLNQFISSFKFIRI